MSGGAKTLNDLAVGKSGVILEIQGNDEIAVRLMEMGMIPGTEFTVLGTAPLGDPLEIEVRGYRLSLRRSEARRVEIEPN